MVNEEREAANNICNNDGGVLATVITMDDKSALDYYVNQTVENVWIGLKKIENDVSCIDNDCDGKLRWQNGYPFVFDSTIQDSIRGNGGGSNPDCFKRKYKNPYYNDLPCNQKAHFLCQIVCPGETLFN